MRAITHIKRMLFVGGARRYLIRVPQGTWEMICDGVRAYAAASPASAALHAVSSVEPPSATTTPKATLSPKRGLRARVMGSAIFAPSLKRWQGNGEATRTGRRA